MYGMKETTGKYNATLLSVTHPSNNRHAHRSYGIFDLEIDFCMNADDNEFSQRAPPDHELRFVQSGTQTCTDVLSWMNLNRSKLMLNADKTEVIAVGTSSCLGMVDKNSVNFGGVAISP